MAGGPFRGSQQVQIEGLRGMQMRLRRMPAAVQAQFKRENEAIAEDVKSAAQSLAESEGGVAEKAAPSLRVQKGARAATLRLGDRSHPFALGSEYGAKHDIPRVANGRTIRGWNQFEPWKGNQFQSWGDGPGYWIMPTIRGKRREIEAKYLAAFERASIASGFPIAGNVGPAASALGGGTLRGALGQGLV